MGKKAEPIQVRGLQANSTMAQAIVKRALSPDAAAMRILDLIARPSKKDPSTGYRP
jgi:hypothetical protein